jgi:hypothetical protein
MVARPGAGVAATRADLTGDVTVACRNVTVNIED